MSVGQGSKQRPAGKGGRRAAKKAEGSKAAAAPSACKQVWHAAQPEMGGHSPLIGLTDMQQKRRVMTLSSIVRERSEFAEDLALVEPAIKKMLQLT